MLVFDLPSFPYVFKVIKDFYPPQKDTTREQIKGKYLLVKQHDRVGRMADTLEYSQVALPARRASTTELIAELREVLRPASSRYDRRRRSLVIRHVYIERRMIPLNIYLAHASDSRADRARGDRVRQRHQGPGGRQHLPRRHAVEELRRHAPRQGGVLRLRRDRVPHRLQLPPRSAPRNEEEEMSGEVWYTVGQNDVFPETFGPFLLGNPPVRERVHEAPRRPAGRRRSGRTHKERILAGHVHDVFPVSAREAFRHRDPARRRCARRAPNYS